MYMTFILVQDTSMKVVLGYPYAALIEPFAIDDENVNMRR